MIAQHLAFMAVMLSVQSLQKTSRSNCHFSRFRLRQKKSRRQILIARTKKRKSRGGMFSV